MTRTEMAEAVAVLGKILDALLGTLTGKLDRSQMKARNAIGALRAYAEDKIDDGAVGAPLLNCFELCRDAGATRVAMDSIRVAMVAYVPKSIPAVALASTAIFLSLLEQVQLIGEETFESREDIDALLTVMNAEFDPAEDFAANFANDPRVYQTLIALHAAVTNDLTNRSRPLPRMVNYSFPQRMPSLVLSVRIYGEASRADQLRRENRVVHPAFCVSSGRCLSA